MQRSGLISIGRVYALYYEGYKETRDIILIRELWGGTDVLIEYGG